MKKLSKKLLAIVLAVLMVATSVPFAALAATDAGNSVLQGLSDEINNYRNNYMTGQKVYTNMEAAYDAYINAVRVYDKAKFGADNVSAQDITTAKNSLATACANMAEWTPFKGTTVPTTGSGNRGFSNDSNATQTNSDANYSITQRIIPAGSGNSYAYDVYNACYQNLGYVDRDFSTERTWKPDSKFTMGIMIPKAVIIYDGSNGFKARIGAMIHGKYGSANRRIAGVFENGNDYLEFGSVWYEAGANASSDDGYVSALSSFTNRYNTNDLVIAISAPSPNDLASGTSTPYQHGSRTIQNSNGKKDGYLGNYLEFEVPESSTYFSAASNNSSMSITSLPLGSCTGGITTVGADWSGGGGTDMCSCDDNWTGSVTVDISVLNYSLLINKINAAKQNLRITAQNPYLEGGVRGVIQAINNACSWNPNGVSSISSLVNTMDGYISAIDTAVNNKYSDTSPYGLLGTKLEAVLATTGTLGDWYNVNHDTDSYSNESIETFVTAFTYAQRIFDQNTTFAASYTFSPENITVGSGDTAVTVAVPAATKTVQQVYDDLMSARLQASNRADATVLTLYIEELTVALANADVFGIKASQTEENMINAIENAKYNIWGETTYTYTDAETGLEETITVSNYGNDAKLPKAGTSGQRRIDTEAANLLPYIKALQINTEKNITYNDATGALNSLSRILQDMADTNLYPRGDYVNGDTLDEGIAYVNNNFVAKVIPNDQTAVTAGIVQAKVDDYKAKIQYCQDIIDGLLKTFLALDNGTMINQGTLEYQSTNQIENKWWNRFTRYNNVIVLRTTKQNSNLSLGGGSISFWQRDTTAWGSDNEYAAVLDSINLNDTHGASNSIHKENAMSTSELPSVALSESECAEYPGCLSVSTTNGGTYGIANLVGKQGKPDGNGGYKFGKAGPDGSLTSAVATTEGTMSAAAGIWAFDNTTTLVAGNMYLDLPAESAVTLSRTTVPKKTTYSFTGYFGVVFYWTADGAGASALKNVYNGYYHERVSDTYTQNATVVDISNLKELVTTVNNLNKNDYTEASWNNMKAKLAAAADNNFGTASDEKTFKEVTTDSLMSQLNTRYVNLYDSWKALIPAATNIELTRPYAQSVNESKDIGAVVRDTANNQWYIKYNTNNDVTAQNTYGTYTTNTWNAFKNAYEAGDVAIYGDGTNAGIYATPTYDTSGNTDVVGTRGYARFKNSDGDPLDVGDLDALGLTINDMEQIEQAQGVSLSDAQAAINQLAANIKSAYTNLKRWATFTPVDSAVTALNNAFSGNYNRKYTVDSLNNINTTFAGLSTSYYTIANDAAAQHALNGSGIAVYDEDDDAAIAAEATTINSCLPPTASSMDIDSYTPSAIIAQAQNAATDPDAYDAAEAVQLATALSQQIFATVNIAPLNNLAVEGVNFASNDEIDAELAQIMTHVNAVTYDVVVKDTSGNVLATYEDQPYGTTLTIASRTGDPVEWTYSYESRTVSGQKPTRVGARTEFVYTVIGDTTIIEDEASGSAAKGYKILFDDSLNHAYAVEYAPEGSTLTIGQNNVVINYPNGESKEVGVPNYAFYNFTGFSRSGTIDVTKDITIVANYAPDYTADGYDLTVAVIKNDQALTSDFFVGYSDKIELSQDSLRGYKIGRINYAGKILINGEEDTLSSFANSVDINGTVYAYTVVFEEDYEAWLNGRNDYLATAYGKETPMKIGTEFKFFPTGNAIIVVYQTQADYEQAVTDGFINAAPHTTVKPELILSNTKFTMHGRVYTPDVMNDVVECGILMYLGNESIEADDLSLATYSTLDGAYRLKYSKSLQFNNINVSVTRTGERFSGKTVRVRYRSYVTYRTTDNQGNPVIRTMYSGLADDTQPM